jgi:hypothetical protein
LIARAPRKPELAMARELTEQERMALAFERGGKTFVAFERYGRRALARRKHALRQLTKFSCQALMRVLRPSKPDARQHSQRCQSAGNS